MNKKKVLKILMLVLILAFVIGVIFMVLKLTGLWESINSIEKLQSLILSLGIWGRTAFVFLQFLQVTFIPIPSPIVIGAGSLIYGPLQAGILSLAGILLGSAFAFFLGKMFGEKIVSFMVGEESCQKWRKFLSRCKYTFVIMMLLPCFPDDILCLVAGLTDMSWTFFMTTQFVARPIGVFVVSYFSSGQIIPFEGWGLLAWAVIIVASFTLIFFSAKYSDKIQKFLERIFKRKKKA